MLKSLFYIFLISNFVSVQALASVCKTKCSLIETSKKDQNQKSNEHQDCHSTKASNKKENGDSDCGSICKAEDQFKVDAEHSNFSDLFAQIDVVSLPAEVSFLNHALFFTTSTHDPPGQGFHLGLPIFIQKSSFLI